MPDVSAKTRFGVLASGREQFLNRCRAYAELTVPRICPPIDYKQENDEVAHDFQSVGAQCINVLSNKIMLALFAPSRPFFRVDLSDKEKLPLLQAGVSEPQLQEILSSVEKKATDLLDQMHLRPKLQELIIHLLVTGNCLEIERDDTIDIFPLIDYVVKRDFSGKPCEIIYRQSLTADKLEEGVREYLAEQSIEYSDDHECCVYYWYKRKGGKFYLETYVEEYLLDDKKYKGKWDEDKCPAKPQVWVLSSGADYGTGLVEDYARDFSAISTLSKALIEGGVLVSEFRWMLSPTSSTQPEDIAQGENGDVISGDPNSLAIITSGNKGNDLSIVQTLLNEYVRRVYTGFLVLSGAVRDSERTTATEIQLLQQELEQQLGGGYSRIAVHFQVPFGEWLLKQLDLSIKGTDLKLTVITGLNAMSRTGDVEKMTSMIAALAQMAAVPEPVLARLNIDNIVATLAAGFGLSASTFVKSEQQIQQEMAQAQQAQLQQQAAMNTVDAQTIPE